MFLTHVHCSQLIQCVFSCLSLSQLVICLCQDCLPIFLRLMNGLSRPRVTHFCWDYNLKRPCCSNRKETVELMGKATTVISSLLNAGSSEPCAGRWFSVPLDLRNS